MSMVTGLPLRAFRELSGQKLANYLPWALFGAPGVVVQKDGLLQRTFRYRGPDVASTSKAKLDALAWQMNESLKRLGSGWALSFDVPRFQTSHYQGAAFANRAAYLIDEERRLAFTNGNDHFASDYFLTFTWLPPSDVKRKAIGLFFKEGDERSIDRDIAEFVRVTDDIAGIMAAKLIIVPLSDSETLTFLSGCLSLDWSMMRAPEGFILLDRILGANEIHNGAPLRVNDWYVGIVAIRDFPVATYTGIFDALNRAGFEYRWTSRFISLDKVESLKLIESYQSKWYGQKRSLKQLAGESMSKDYSNTRINHGAASMEDDANEAHVAVVNDVVAYGYYTSTLAVWGRTREEVEEKSTEAKKIIQATGFRAITEKVNALEAFFGMLPGNVYANVQRVPISTGNMSHLIPLTAIWAGSPHNEHMDKVSGVGLPHVVCSTNSGTIFNLNLNVTDVGMFFVGGPTGAGKSTLLGLLCAQFARYSAGKADGVRVIIFDKDRSAKKLTIAFEGRYYEPVTQEDYMFQPLRRLEDTADRIWAAEFIEILLGMAKVNVLADHRKAIEDALSALAGKGEDERTMTAFTHYVQHKEVQEGLGAYCNGGRYGSIFDSVAEGIQKDSWMMFEMGALMELGEAATVPAFMFLFREIERMFDGTPTLLAIDEGWMMLRHPIAVRKMQTYLKTLRKKNVFVGLFTQNIADAAKSEIKEDILQQCHTKIFLPDAEAASPGLMEMYKGFGLSEEEIELLAHAIPKRDYVIKTSQGIRMFSLDLGPITKALVCNPDAGHHVHELLDELLEADEDNPRDALIEILECMGVLGKADEIYRDELDTRVAL